MRHLQLHRRTRGQPVRRRRRGGAARKPDLVRDDPSAPRPAARPAARRRPQSGARLHAIWRSSRSARSFPAASRASRRLQATGLLVGATAPRDPHGSRRPVDLYDAKADAEAVLAALGAPARVQITRKARRLVPPRPLGRDRRWARTRIAHLRRGASAGAARDGREGPGGRLHRRLSTRCPSPR